MTALGYADSSVEACIYHITLMISWSNTKVMKERKKYSKRDLFEAAQNVDAYGDSYFYVGLTELLDT